MRRFSFVGIVTVSLIFGQLVPTAAYAATTFVSTVTPGPTAEVGGSISPETGIDPQSSGTYQEVLTQTWTAGRGALGEVNAPGQWGLEYLVSGSWLGTRPDNPGSINGVRASGELVSEGTSAGNQRLESTVNAASGTPTPALIPSFGRGDGWAVTLTPRFIINVFHHSQYEFMLECVIRATSQLCDPELPYTVAGFSTSNVSDVTYFGGKAYALVQNTETDLPSVICTDVSTLPFVPCDTPYVDLGDSMAFYDDYAAEDYLSSQQVLGTKLYAVDFTNDVILCFDMALETECFGPAVDGLANGYGSAPGFTSIIDDKLFIAADMLYCFDLSVDPVAACTGTWPATSDAPINVIPSMDDTGTIVEGVCSIGTSEQPGVYCFNFDGTVRQVPLGLDSLASVSSTGFRGGVGYFETRAWIGSKVYWPANPNGEDWDPGIVTCYDWENDSACVGFSTTTDIGYDRYAFVLDPGNSNCIWTNGDDGAISSFDATTGAGGCAAVGAALYYDAPLSCSTVGAVKAFDKLTIVTIPEIPLADIRVSLFTSDGVAVVGFENITPDPTTGEIDLTSLDPLVSTDEFFFELTATNATQEELEQLSGALSYTAEAAQLCITITILSSCLGDLTGLTLVPQADFAITSTASIALGSEAPTVDSSTEPFEVLDADILACYFWSTLSEGGSDGINPDDNYTGITDMAWDADGVIYIGGYFQNAGGDPAADNLARWGQNGWEAVAPLNASESSISNRVMSLAFTSSGKLLVGGNFNNANDIEAADHFAILDPDTNQWKAAGNDPEVSPFDGDVRDIAVDSLRNQIFVGGTFDGHLRAVDITTNEVSTVGVGDEFSSNINVLEIGLDGRLYVGGQFNAIGESTTNHYAAAWDGNEWGPISLNQTAETFTGYVWKFAFSPNKVYVSGGFAGIKQLEISDDIWSDVGSLLGETRSLVVASNGDLYAAGMDYGTNQKYFARYDGTQWNQLKERGALDPTANTNSCDYNWCGSWKVDQSPTGQIWFGGEFEDVAGLSPVDNLAVWGNTAAASVRYMPVVAPRRDGATAVTPAELVKQSMMRRLYFAGNSYVLSPSTKASLKKIAAALTKGTTIQIVISGYVLTNKTTAWQRQLSKNRGIAVARYLRKLGVKASYEVEAMGKALESTGKARRVEVRIKWITTPSK